MKIARIRAYQVDLPLHEGSYKWSGGKSVTVFDTTVVEIETDQGVIGYGEVCPLGPFYLPAYARGVRAVTILGPTCHFVVELVRLGSLSGNARFLVGSFVGMRLGGREVRRHACEGQKEGRDCSLWPPDCLLPVD